MGKVGWECNNGGRIVRNLVTMNILLYVAVKMQGTYTVRCSLEQYGANWATRERIEGIDVQVVRIFTGVGFSQ